MCYEWSGWFSKARAATPAQERKPEAKKVVQPSAPATQPEPATAKRRVDERETTPA